MDERDTQALAHYQALIKEYFPPELATALAAARYQHALSAPTLELPRVRETLVAVAEQHPDLKRDFGHAVAAIERRGAGRPKKVV